MTAFARLCSFLQLAGRFENSDSKSCTCVVTTRGASQLSAATLAAGVSFAGSRALWCSRRTSPPSGRRASRRTSAVWSMMDVNGSAITMRWRPVARACLRANERLAKVLPPPVGYLSG